MRCHLEIGKRRKELIISFKIEKDNASFPTFTSANDKEYKGFQWGKSAVKVSLFFC